MGEESSRCESVRESKEMGGRERERESKKWEREDGSVCERSKE